MFSMVSSKQFCRDYCICTWNHIEQARCVVFLHRLKIVKLNLQQPPNYAKEPWARARSITYPCLSWRVDLLTAEGTC